MSRSRTLHYRLWFLSRFRRYGPARNSPIFCATIALLNMLSVEDHTLTAGRLQARIPTSHKSLCHHAVPSTFRIASPAAVLRIRDFLYFFLSLLLFAGFLPSKTTFVRHVIANELETAVASLSAGRHALGTCHFPVCRCLKSRVAAAVLDALGKEGRGQDIKYGK